MNKMDLKYYINNLYENKWIWLVCLLCLFIMSLFVFGTFEKRVKVSCRIVDRGASFSQYGNEPFARCKLDNGFIVVVRGSHTSTYKVGDMIIVTTKKGNTIDK